MAAERVPRSVSLALGVGIAVTLYSILLGPIFSRMPPVQEPLSITQVEQVGTADGPAVAITVRNNERYLLTGEVWYVIMRAGEQGPVYEHPPVAFGPLAPNVSETVRLDRPAWAVADDFTIEVRARETFPMLPETVADPAPSLDAVLDPLLQAGIGRARLLPPDDAGGPSRLQVEVTLLNPAQETHTYRAILTVYPFLTPETVLYRTEFQYVTLQPGESATLRFEDPLDLEEGAYAVSCWVQVAREADLYEHVARLDAPGPLTTGD